MQRREAESVAWVEPLVREVAPGFDVAGDQEARNVDSGMTPAPNGSRYNSPGQVGEHRWRAILAPDAPATRVSIPLETPSPSGAG